MTRIFVFSEGQTEELFVKNVLCQHFINKSIYLFPIIFSTSAEQKGGSVSYQKLKNQVTEKCLSDKSAYLTLMVSSFFL